MNFRLNLREDKHHELFRRALSGKLIELQQELPSNAQELSWRGYERNSYLGIPWVAGRAHALGKYELFLDDVPQKLVIQESSNRGLLLPLRTHQRIRLTSAEDIHLIWFSEMKKLRVQTLEKNYLRIGRILGVEGFAGVTVHEVIPGSVISQLSIGLERSEFSGDLDFKRIGEELRSRCFTLNLPCRKPRRSEAILRKFSSLVALPWDTGRQQIAGLLLREPALIWAVLRTSGKAKKAYFRFLSETHQSLEGWAEALQ